MKIESFKPRQIAVAVFSRLEGGVETGESVAGFCRSEGVSASVHPLNDPALSQALQQGEFDLMIVLGGDGTMLRAGHLCAPLAIPILGVNMGRFGFLTEVEVSQWQGALQRVLAGNFWLENRMMLHAVHKRQGETLDQWDVINEVMVGRGAIVRPVHLRTMVDDAFLTTYVADGLIVATATGSTAYAMAVGGPILTPAARNLLIIPVAPHLSFDRAVVLNEGSVVSIELETSHEASLSVDGQTPVVLLDDDRVEVSAGEYTVQFVRTQESGFFYRKLMSLMNQNPSVGKKK
ncbi:MAG: NAD(+)/NADH kinase [Anaerolineales bacterium]|nr:NAD(+)/NADH kinase [Anaerolineales bacterium]